MDYHGLPRKQLQALCKKHEIPANQTNAQMADALSALLKENPNKVGKESVKQNTVEKEEEKEVPKILTRSRKGGNNAPQNEVLQACTNQNAEAESNGGAMAVKTRARAGPVKENSKEKGSPEKENFEKPVDIKKNASRAEVVPAKKAGRRNLRKRHSDSKDQLEENVAQSVDNASKASKPVLPKRDTRAKSSKAEEAKAVTEDKSGEDNTEDAQEDLDAKTKTPVVIDLIESDDEEVSKEEESAVIQEEQEKQAAKPQSKRGGHNNKDVKLLKRIATRRTRKAEKEEATEEDSSVEDHETHAPEKTKSSAEDEVAIAKPKPILTRRRQKNAEQGVVSEADPSGSPKQIATRRTRRGARVKSSEGNGSETVDGNIGNHSSEHNEVNDVRMDKDVPAKKERKCIRRTCRAKEETEAMVDHFDRTSEGNVNGTIDGNTVNRSTEETEAKNGRIEENGLPKKEGNGICRTRRTVEKNNLVDDYVEETSEANGNETADHHTGSHSSEQNEFKNKTMKIDVPVNKERNCRTRRAREKTDSVSDHVEEISECNGNATVDHNTGNHSLEQNEVRDGTMDMDIHAKKERNGMRRGCEVREKANALADVCDVKDQESEKADNSRELKETDNDTKIVTRRTRNARKGTALSSKKIEVSNSVTEIPEENNNNDLKEDMDEHKDKIPNAKKHFPSTMKIVTRRRLRGSKTEKTVKVEKLPENDNNGADYEEADVEHQEQVQSNADMTGRQRILDNDTSNGEKLGTTGRKRHTVEETVTTEVANDDATECCENATKDTKKVEASGALKLAPSIQAREKSHRTKARVMKDTKVGPSDHPRTRRGVKSVQNDDVAAAEKDDASEFPKKSQSQKASKRKHNDQTIEAAKVTDKVVPTVNSKRSRRIDKENNLQTSDDIKIEVPGNEAEESIREGFEQETLSPGKDKSQDLKEVTNLNNQEINENHIAMQGNVNAQEKEIVEMDVQMQQQVTDNVSGDGYSTKYMSEEKIEHNASPPKPRRTVRFSLPSSVEEEIPLSKVEEECRSDAVSESDYITNCADSKSVTVPDYAEDEKEVDVTGLESPKNADNNEKKDNTLSEELVETEMNSVENHEHYTLEKEATPSLGHSIQNSWLQSDAISNENKNEIPIADLYLSSFDKKNQGDQRESYDFGVSGIVQEDRVEAFIKETYDADVKDTEPETEAPGSNNAYHNTFVEEEAGKEITASLDNQIRNHLHECTSKESDIETCNINIDEGKDKENQNGIVSVECGNPVENVAVLQDARNSVILEEVSYSSLEPEVTASLPNQNGNHLDDCEKKETEIETCNTSVDNVNDNVNESDLTSVECSNPIENAIILQDSKNSGIIEELTYSSLVPEVIAFLDNQNDNNLDGCENKESEMLCNTYDVDEPNNKENQSDVASAECSNPIENATVLQKPGNSGLVEEVAYSSSDDQENSSDRSEDQDEVSDDESSYSYVSEDEVSMAYQSGSYSDESLEYSDEDQLVNNFDEDKSVSDEDDPVDYSVEQSSGDSDEQQSIDYPDEEQYADYSEYSMYDSDENEDICLEESDFKHFVSDKMSTELLDVQVDQASQGKQLNGDIQLYSTEEQEELNGNQEMLVEQIEELKSGFTPYAIQLRHSENYSDDDNVSLDGCDKFKEDYGLHCQSEMDETFFSLDVDEDLLNQLSRLKLVDSASKMKGLHASGFFKAEYQQVSNTYNQNIKNDFQLDDNATEHEQISNSFNDEDDLVCGPDEPLEDVEEHQENIEYNSTPDRYVKDDANVAEYFVNGSLKPFESELEANIDVQSTVVSRYQYVHSMSEALKDAEIVADVLRENNSTSSTNCTIDIDISNNIDEKADVSPEECTNFEPVAIHSCKEDLKVPGLNAPSLSNGERRGLKEEQIPNTEEIHGKEVKFGQISVYDLAEPTMDDASNEAFCEYNTPVANMGIVEKAYENLLPDEENFEVHDELFVHQQKVSENGEGGNLDCIFGEKSLGIVEKAYENLLPDEENFEVHDELFAHQQKVSENGEVGNLDCIFGEKSQDESDFKAPIEAENGDSTDIDVLEENSLEQEADNVPVENAAGEANPEKSQDETDFKTPNEAQIGDSTDTDAVLEENSLEGEADNVAVENEADNVAVENGDSTDIDAVLEENSLEQEADNVPVENAASEANPEKSQDETDFKTPNEAQIGDSTDTDAVLEENSLEGEANNVAVENEADNVAVENAVGEASLELQATKSIQNEEDFNSPNKSIGYSSLAAPIRQSQFVNSPGMSPCLGLLFGKHEIVECKNDALTADESNNVEIRSLHSGEERLVMDGCSKSSANKCTISSPGMSPCIDKLFDSYELSPGISPCLDKPFSAHQLSPCMSPYIERLSVETEKDASANKLPISIQNGNIDQVLAVSASLDSDVNGIEHIDRQSFNDHEAPDSEALEAAQSERQMENEDESNNEQEEEQSVIKEANQLEFSPCLGLVSGQESVDCLKSVHKEEALNSEAHEHVKSEHQMGNEVESSSEQDEEQSPLREASQLESFPFPRLVSAGQENFDCLKSLHEDETLNSEVHEHVTTENQMENEVESSNKQDGDHSLVKEANQLESSPTLGLVFGQENVDCLSELIHEDEVVQSEYEKENSVLSSNEQDEADGLVEEANQFEFSPCLALVFGREDDDCLSKSFREDEALGSEIHNIGSKNEQYKKDVLDLVNGQQDADCLRKSLNEAEAMDSETHEIFQCDYQKEYDTVRYNEQDEAANHFKLSPPILEENVDCSPSCKEKVTGSPAFSSEKVSDDTPKWGGTKDGGQTNSLNLTPEYEVMLSGHSFMAKLSETPSLSALSPSGSLCAFSSSGFAASGEALDVSPCLNSLVVEEEISNKKASPGVSSARVSSPVSSKAPPIFNNLFEEEVITTDSVKPEEEEFSGKRISPCDASMDLSSSVKSPYVCSDDASHHILFEETKATIQSSIPLNLKQEMEENNRPSQDKLYDNLKSPTGDMELNGIETAQPSATAMELQTDTKISSPASLSKSHGRAPEVASPCKKQKLNDTSDHEVDEIGCTNSLLEEATARKSIDSSISEEEMKAAGAEITRQPQLVTAGTMTSCLPSVQRIQNMHNRLQNILEQTEKTLQFERSTPRIKMSASGAKSAIKPRICMKENSPVVLPQLSKTVSKRDRETPTAEKGVARRLALQNLPPNISEQFASPNPWRQR